MFSPPGMFCSASACHQTGLPLHRLAFAGYHVKCSSGWYCPAESGLAGNSGPWQELCWAGLPLSGARVLRSAVYTGGSHALGLPCPAPCTPCWRLPSLLDAPGIGDEAVPSVITRLALLSGQRSFQSILEPHCAPYSPAQAASERLGRMFCSSPQR